MKQNKVGILGIGAIGSVIASILNQNNRLSLFYYNRSPRSALKIKKNSSNIEIPIVVQTNFSSSPSLDWLIICLKEHHFVKAKTWLKQLIGPATKVVVIRNGLKLKEPILAYTTADKVLECLIDCPTQAIENGYYQQFRKPILSLPKSTLSQDFSALFIGNKIDINLVLDFKTSAWKKLCESASLGAILCLSGETCWIFKDLKIRNLYQKILREAITVATADGARIEATFQDKMLDKVLTYPAHKGSSMLSDRNNGQPIELGAKNGIISKMAAFYDVNTPLNDLVCTLLKFTNQMKSEE